MTPRAISRRYASALFDVASRAGSLERVERDLAAFGALVAEHADLRGALAAPGVAPQKKVALVEALWAAAGGVAPEVQRLVALLAQRDRLANLPDIIAAFESRLMAMRRILPAEIVAAAPMDEARKRSLAEALSRATGGQVRVSETVDPAIIGGVVARVGGTVYDGSIARQLERMRAQLRAGI